MRLSDIEDTVIEYVNNAERPKIPDDHTLEELVLVIYVYLQYEDPDTAKNLLVSHKDEFTDNFDIIYSALEVSYLQQKNRFQEAGNKIQQALDVYEKRDETEKQAFVDWIIDLRITNFTVLFFKGLTDKAQNEISKIEVLRPRTDSKLLLAESYKIEGNFAMQRGDYEKSLKFYQKALDLFQTMNYSRSVLYTYSNMGVVYSNMGNYQEAIRSLSHCIDDTNSPMNRGIARINLAKVYRDLSNFNLAISTYDDAISDFQKMNIQTMTSLCYKEKAELYQQKGEFEKAENFFQKSHDIVKKFNNKEQEMALYYKMSRLYSNMGRYQLAEEYLEETINYYRNQNSVKQLIEAILRLSGIKRELGELDSANELIEMAQELITDHNLYETEVRVNYERGLMFRDLYKFEAAIEYLSKTLDTLETDQLVLQTNIQHDLTSIYLLTGEVVNALKVNKDAVKLCEENGLKLSLAQLLTQQGLIYKEMGLVDEAFRSISDAYAIYTDVDERYLIAFTSLKLLELSYLVSSDIDRDELILVIEDITSKTRNLNIRAIYQFMKAIMLKQEKRPSKMFSAIDHLENIVEMGGIDKELIISALLHLIDLYLAEFRLEPTLAETLDLIKRKMTKLEKLAVEADNYLLQIHLNLLNAELYFISGKIRKCFDLFDECWKLIEKKSLEFMSKRIISAKSELEHRLESYQAMVEVGKDVLDRITSSRIETYISDALSISQFNKPLVDEN